MKCLLHSGLYMCIVPSNNQGDAEKIWVELDSVPAFRVYYQG